ncbi:SDR family oxidoreductase [Lichenihabitans sp. PAMC28606]|uniref:UDP-glucuronic acid decarboxylase family protein n=1 Tax=Lichenihabitans sp. PAMC28606 TaxID=2880932 RepID=UPI001D0A7398|nr:UDP-glucuronic acid decarboxylase family protein [Lichenihabitans sp. PAMC28606]UDL93466.1 SDR family oxidoreductase [Lichenihabitans sp. PAMC28606]
MKNGKDRLVFITGGAGFIGSHLCEAYLDDGASVLCLDNMQTGSHDNLESFAQHPRFHMVEADVTAPLPQAMLPRSATIDLIINAACAASPPQYQAQPQHTMLTNVVGTNSLLALAETHAARFLQCSTSEIYGDPLVHPQIESYWGNVNPTGPRACYDEGKRAAETLCFDYKRHNGVDVRVARIFNTYGPRMQISDGRVVSNVICQALTGREITLYGDGQQTRSFCFVTDLVDGLRRLADHPRAIEGAVNLGNPNELTVADLVATVMRMTQARSTIVQRPLPVDDPQRRKPDISLATALLGWTPAVDLNEGLERTIAFFVDRLTPEVIVGERAAPEPIAVQ